MPFAEWIPRLEVHVAVIDDQHLQLFAWINRLWDAYQTEDEAGLKAVLGFLVEYAELHFSAEEALMDRAGYDGADAHKGLHREFKAKVAEFEHRQTAAFHSVIPELLEYLRDWLVHHIAHEDRKLGTFLLSKGMV